MRLLLLPLISPSILPTWKWWLVWSRVSSGFLNVSYSKIWHPRVLLSLPFYGVRNCLHDLEVSGWDLFHLTKSRFIGHNCLFALLQLLSPVKTFQINKWKVNIVNNHCSFSFTSQWHLDFYSMKKNCSQSSKGLLYYLEISSCSN